MYTTYHSHHYQIRCSSCHQVTLDVDVPSRQSTLCASSIVVPYHHHHHSSAQHCVSRLSCEHREHVVVVVLLYNGLPYCSRNRHDTTTRHDVNTVSCRAVLSCRVVSSSAAVVGDGELIDSDTVYHYY
jgi:hypothetical protein